MKKTTEKVTKAFIWSSVDRFLVQFIQFFLGIIMARILSPSDYGIIGMLAIFIALSNSIIDSGFSYALIQKKDRTLLDYSTVFYINIVLGLFSYILFWGIAPLIARFYNVPVLEEITQVMALNMIFNSLLIVQRTKLTIELRFNIIAYISIVACVISGCCGLYMAYNNWGVWALVWQTVILNFVTLVLTWRWARWMPMLAFSMTSFKRLFNYGSKLLITGLYGPIFDHLNTLIIGKQFSSLDLGYYTRSYSLAQYPSSNIASVISRVSFPVLSSLQDNDEKLLHSYRKLIKDTYLLVAPLMIGLATISRPLISLLLTDKWVDCATYLTILSFGMLWYPLCSYNINLLLVKGAVSLHLRLDLIKKCVNILVLFITVPLGVKAICFGLFVNAIFSWFNTLLIDYQIVSKSITYIKRCL